MGALGRGIEPLPVLLFPVLINTNELIDVVAVPFQSGEFFSWRCGKFLMPVLGRGPPGKREQDRGHDIAVVFHEYMVGFLVLDGLAAVGWRSVDVSTAGSGEV